ncbi:MAG: c-type cytochrome biogenesis protein CcmI [Paracoccaceae bacterium]|nr:MAG: c-type cytochrome biogenesis protein CcmI [Paracoccaceae bacterium]
MWTGNAQGTGRRVADTVWFWVAAGGMALAVTALLLVSLRRGGDDPGATARHDAQVYRDQLAEIARDVARGVVAEDEAARLRTEVARRLLAADTRAAAPAVAAARGPRALAAMLAVATVIGGGIWGYLTLGAPGYPDLPLSARHAMAETLRAARPAQAEAEAAATALPPAEAPPDFMELMAQLRSRLAERPDDLVGHRLLAENEARLGRYPQARAAQERVIAIRGGEASAQDHVLLARYMIAAAGGAVSPEAEAALAEALARAPNDPDALFFMGIAQLQTGRPDLAFTLWRRYLEVAPDESPWQPEVRGRIGDLAAVAGARFDPPPPLAGAAAGPDAAAMAAAAEMPEAERAAMIGGMVDRLSQRLATEGGPAEDWARLIRALGVLGRTDRARAIADEARGSFAGREGDLALIDAAAREAGVAE